METRNLRKERVGVVKSNKMNKSVTVSIERKEKHTMYGKFMKKTSTFVAEVTHVNLLHTRQGDT